MEEVKDDPAPPAPPPPIRPGMAAAVHRRRVQALSREQQRDLEQNADLLALCKTFGLQVDLPRIFIAGPECAGKSTLMELLFRFLKVGTVPHATTSGREGVARIYLGDSLCPFAAVHAPGLTTMPRLFRRFRSVPRAQEG